MGFAIRSQRQPELKQMKNSTKGMLLSGLVYPGLGQLILGHVVSGIIFVLLATTGFTILLYRIMQRISGAIDQILPLLADKKLDLNTLIKLLNRHPAGGWGLENISLIGIIGCWLLAIGHAYLAGKKIDRHVFKKNIPENSSRPDGDLSI
jgi:TM2 domain-containing membrane protein YozV